MKNMYFKNILIADVQNKTARFVSFKKGLNVITSSENHVGKSSIIKSLYYTLGAEVKFDNRWNKNSKITIVTIDVDGFEYRVVRFIRKFAIFKGTKLILLTDSVTTQLAPKLAEVFDFYVYLSEKNDEKRVVQAPPAFTFMPYYIDQDNGWTELYNSFERMNQFSKQERAKSLYFHLNIYTKERIELQAQKDKYKSEKKELETEEQKQIITINALSKELNSIIPAYNEKELESQLEIPRKGIEELVKVIGQKRNTIQKLQTSLEQHENQLNIIHEFQQIEVHKEKNNNHIHTCPNCGFELEDNLYKIVRNNYNQSNAAYLYAQIELIVNNIKAELITQEQQYINLMTDLKNQEHIYDESQDAYDIYLRYRGLKKTLRKYQNELGINRIAQDKKEESIKRINKELKKQPNKKTIERIYIDYVKRNILSLGAWARDYEGNISLLKGINAQGSLMPKIILSQYIGLFQTMKAINCPTIRFPFVVDSPRSMESSVTSSKEILEMISKINSLPQIIVATVDYDEFVINRREAATKLFLSDKFNLLNKDTYKEKSKEIEGLYRLIMSEANNVVNNKEYKQFEKA